MIARASLAALLVASLTTAPAVARHAAAAELVSSVADLVAHVQTSVVRIIVVQPRERAASVAETAVVDELPAIQVGSGFVIDPSGLIATNRHVVEHGLSIFVFTPDGVRYAADLVGMTVKADIALLRIHPPQPLAAVTFADSDAVRVGDPVVAIGSPYGFNNTVTAGVVSAVNRDIFDGPFDDFIQTDAAINHGNSGGPLFNLAGQVIGMNSALYGPTAASSGLGFAIPANDLRFVFDRLQRTGRVGAGMLPIRAQQVTWMIAQAVGLTDLNGALVDAADPSLRGEIRPGDVVLTFNGEAVLDPRDLARKVLRVAIGNAASVEVLRDGTRQTAHVTVQGWPDAKLPHGDPSQRHLGVEFVAAPGGVTVASVDPTGTAADSGIERGDLVLRVQQTEASNPAQALRALTATDRPFALALIKRGDVLAWLPIAVP
jgi:serine protease Do